MSRFGIVHGTILVKLVEFLRRVKQVFTKFVRIQIPLDFFQDMVTGLIVENDRIKGVKTSMGLEILAKRLAWNVISLSIV